LAAQAGCRGVFIGFESPTPEGLRGLGRKSDLLKGRDLRADVRRIQRHGMMVAGSFIMGLDMDKTGIGKRISDAASQCGMDTINVGFLTPLPGTRLWDLMKAEERIALDTFPEDWKYYTLTFPVARYKHLSLGDIIEEMLACNRSFYSLSRVLSRVCSNFWHLHSPMVSLVGNLSYRRNFRLDIKAFANFQHQLGVRRGQ